MSYHAVFLFVYVCFCTALFVYYLWNLIRGSSDEIIVAEESVSRLAQIIAYPVIKSAEVEQYAEFPVTKHN